MFLIDGYNLLHCLARGRATEAAREQVIAKIVEYCTRGNYRAWIVFDATGGMKRREQRGPVDVYNVPNAVASIQDEIRPIDDIRSTAEYRRRVAANLLARMLDRRP